MLPLTHAYTALLKNNIAQSTTSVVQYLSLCALAGTEMIIHNKLWRTYCMWKRKPHTFFVTEYS